MSARSLNKVQLIGNLTREPELRYTTGGTPVVTFGLATNKSWKDQEGSVKEIAEFHNIVAWNKMAEICQQLLAKGMKVYIEGSLSTRSWEADDGSTRYKTEVRVNDMILLDSKGKQGAGFDSEVKSSAEEPEADISEESSTDEDTTANEDPLEDSDLPF
ncbi:single-stranded DNA-binding protein [Candidatus Dojkabacteria bacterium]|jgi:single-strand DNA-binding protein|uniref:Single-stranded DNA-binding protein n=1 Tax=Candidatus Dojkabacteria bacterium TaxID=2099670 RepID=A0A847ET88_9BACT|nr:single-stranded DNA-binding protein [Candidatus Dojkabacteria bacterium]HRX43946.1 single-stranded DNA-binding protein [Candidatus Dojkabacteria bacterium]